MPTKSAVKNAVKRPLTAEDLYTLQLVEDPQISPSGSHVAFVKVTTDKLQNKYKRNIWLADLTGKAPRVRQFTSGDKLDHSPRWSPDGQTLAFVSARNDAPRAQIYLIGLSGGEARPITSMPNGAANPVWSPDGKRLAFLSRLNAEERANEDSGKEEPPPQTDLEAKHRKEIREDKEKKKADPRAITRFPFRTGTEFFDDRFSHIYVMDAPAEGETAKPRRLSDGDMNFNEIEWSPDGKSIYSIQSRDPDYDPWHQQDVVRFSSTGKRKSFVWVTKTDRDYFNIKASPDGKWLATLRHPRTGSYGQSVHLAILPAKGGPARDLTLKLDRQVEAIHWSSDSKSLYLQAGDHGNVEIYRVTISGGDPVKVIGERRMVTGFTVSESETVAFVASSPERPADVYVRRNRKEERLTDFNKKLLDEVHVAQAEDVSFTAHDGRPIQGWVLKPIGFKKGKKYPLAVNMHGGPHVMWGPAMPSMWLEWQLHAARGYAVFYCNPRGSDGYGSEFSSIITGDWGSDVMRDILTGVETVAALGFVDSKRMALTGGSYAGYMTAWIVSHDNRFACAWSQRGLYNVISMYGVSDIPWFTEREFDVTMPYDALDKCWGQSPLAYVRNIKTPLAIEHQENDYRCPVSEAEQLYTALKRLKREVVFYRYPREGHEMSRSGEPQHRVDRLNRMVGWFDRYCKKKRTVD
ncbi:MAG: S9 family peptidase [Chloroflexi bacterium]|nr:S9 family peptidase [Chloroflexota bacterium]